MLPGARQQAYISMAASVPVKAVVVVFDVSVESGVVSEHDNLDVNFTRYFPAHPPLMPDLLGFPQSVATPSSVRVQSSTSWFRVSLIPGDSLPFFISTG